MKLYRVQAKYKNILLDEMLEAENDKAALDTFQKKVESGDVTEKDAGGFLNGILESLVVGSLTSRVTDTI